MHGLLVPAVITSFVVALVDKYEGKYAHVVKLQLNLSILPYQQPLQMCLESFRESFKDRLSVGDVCWAFILAGQITCTGIFAPERGKDLTHVEKEIREVFRGVEMFQRGRQGLLFINNTFLQAVLNLEASASTCDGNSDPIVLTGEVMDQEEVLAALSEQENGNGVRKFFFCRMWLAYLFRRYNVASEMLTLHQKAVKEIPLYPHCEVIIDTFYHGLVACALIRELGCDGDNIAAWREMSADSFSKIKLWAEDGSAWNFDHKMHLLKAEIAFTEGNMDVAEAAYENAICEAKKTGFINEEALSCERYGLFHANRGHTAEAAKYFTKAERLYRSWNAVRKAEDIKLHLLQLR